MGNDAISPIHPPSPNNPAADGATAKRGPGDLVTMVAAAAAAATEGPVESAPAVHLSKRLQAANPTSPAPAAAVRFGDTGKAGKPATDYRASYEVVKALNAAGNDDDDRAQEMISALTLVNNVDRSSKANEQPRETADRKSFEWIATLPGETRRQLHDSGLKASNIQSLTPAAYARMVTAVGTGFVTPTEQRSAHALLQQLDSMKVLGPTIDTLMETGSPPLGTLSSVNLGMEPVPEVLRMVLTSDGPLPSDAHVAALLATVTDTNQLHACLRDGVRSKPNTGEAVGVQAKIPLSDAGRSAIMVELQRRAKGH